MPVFIALFRGVNVVGRHRLPMKSLPALLERHGCRDVRTYIQSGNVVFRTGAADTARLAKRMAAAVRAAHDFEPQVIVLGVRDLEKAAAANPFPAAEADPTSLHLFFLADRPSKPDTAKMDALRSRTERYVLDGKVFYLHAPDGFGLSKLAARAEALLGVPATARNWRTVTTLVEMARAVGSAR